MGLIINLVSLEHPGILNAYCSYCEAYKAEEIDTMKYDSADVFRIM